MLTRSPAAGVDTFVRQDFGRGEQSLFLFFQGHPEYGAGALLSEFRRDVGRFLKGERDRYPAMPQHYFDAATEIALAAFRQRAERQPREELLAEFPVPANPALVANWQPFAVDHLSKLAVDPFGPEAAASASRPVHGGAAAGSDPGARGLRIAAVRSAARQFPNHRNNATSQPSQPGGDNHE